MCSLRASQVALVVKNLPAISGNIRDIGSIPGLGRSLEEGMATHSSILAWKIPRTEKHGRLQSIGSQRVRHDRSDLARTHAHILWEMINTFTEDNIYDFSSKSYLLASVHERPWIFTPGKHWRVGSLPMLEKIKWIAF